jgi:UDP:flavonoid glycosyltransferase YjiC (YdhE family)
MTSLVCRKFHEDPKVSVHCRVAQDKSEEVEKIVAEVAPGELTSESGSGRAPGMRVLFTTLRNTSHFLPLVPFVEACLRRGHQVLVSAPKDLRERVATTGAEFMPFGHPGDTGLAPIWARMRDASEGEARRIAIGELFAGACAGAALPGLLSVFEQFRPNIVVRESQEYAAVAAAEKHGVRHVRVSITSRYAEKELFALAAPSLDAHGLGIGLPADPDATRLSNEPVLSLFPASLDGVEDGGTTRRFRAPRVPAAPLPNWWTGESASLAPFVYATLGTVTGGMQAMRHHYSGLLEALSPLRARVLLTVGADLAADAFNDVPEHIHVERFVPQDAVLPHASLCICHGGSGTVLGALAAGVPMVVTPMFADQPQNAERLATLGAAIGFPRGQAAPTLVCEAAQRVLAEPSFGQAAKRLQEEMAALPLVDEVGVELERLAGR